MSLNKLNQNNLVSFLDFLHFLFFLIIYIYIYIYEGHSESSMLHLRRAIAEYFCCGNTMPLLIKLKKQLMKNSVLISMQ